MALRLGIDVACSRGGPGSKWCTLPRDVSGPSRDQTVARPAHSIRGCAALSGGVRTKVSVLRGPVHGLRSARVGPTGPGWTSASPRPAAAARRRGAVHCIRRRDAFQPQGIHRVYTLRQSLLPALSWPLLPDSALFTSMIAPKMPFAEMMGQGRHSPGSGTHAEHANNIKRHTHTHTHSLVHVLRWEIVAVHASHSTRSGCKHEVLHVLARHHVEQVERSPLLSAVLKAQTLTRTLEPIGPTTSSIQSATSSRGSRSGVRVLMCTRPRWPSWPSLQKKP